MVNDSENTKQTKNNRLELLFVTALFFAMLMATGPGVMLINRPETFLGIPLVYAWGIGWFFVIAILALITDRMVWRRQSEIDEEEDHAGRE